jgi:hypothetical protein
MRIAIAFAYGAGGEGDPTSLRDKIIKGFAGRATVDPEKDWFLIDWRGPAWKAPESDLVWLVERRWKSAEQGRDMPEDGATAEADSDVVIDELRRELCGNALIDRDAVARSAMKLAYAYVLKPQPYAALTDSLRYVSRGDAVRDSVKNGLRDARKEIDERRRTEPDLVLLALGHSLGGLAMVDALYGQPRDSDLTPDLLVTCGSQAGLLTAADAMHGPRRGKAQPAVFAPWLNVWNPDDYLSYPAEPMYAGTFKGVRDHVVDAGLAYPASHSAYWDDRSWQPVAVDLLRQPTDDGA